MTPTPNAEASPARRQAIEAFIAELTASTDFDRLDQLTQESVAAGLLDALRPALLSRLFMETANTRCVHRYLPGAERCQCGAGEWTGTSCEDVG